MTRSQMIDEAVRSIFARYARFCLEDTARRLSNFQPVHFDVERMKEIRTRFQYIAERDSINAVLADY